MNLIKLMIRRIVPYLVVASCVLVYQSAEAISARSGKESKKDAKAVVSKKAPDEKIAPRSAAEKSTVRSRKSLLNDLRRRVKESKSPKSDRFDRYIDKDRDGIGDQLQRRKRSSKVLPRTARTSKKSPVRAAPRQKTGHDKVKKKKPGR